jgi:hypothetical protein|tara:strand:- start:148 stop:543 length:396 start_codon:yes stop_codon:yes gene_type:complete
MSRTGVAVDTLLTSPQGSIISHPSFVISDTRTGMPFVVIATVGASIVVVGGTVEVVVVVSGAVDVSDGAVELATASGVVVLVVETAGCVVFTADRWVVLVGVVWSACIGSEGAQAISNTTATPLRTTERVF